MNQFMTTQRNDYTVKHVKYPVRPFSFKETSNLLTEYAECYLDWNDKDPPKPNEFIWNYIDYVKKNKKKVGHKYFSNPLNKEIIKTADDNNMRTSTYRRDYGCTISKNTLAHIDMALPDDWELPMTVQRDSYRNPAVFCKEMCMGTKRMRPVNNFTNSPEVNKILQINTGETEYGGVIGTLGQEILEAKTLKRRPMSQTI